VQGLHVRGERSFSALPRAAQRASSGMEAIAPATPSATMFVQLPGMPFESFFSGTASARAPLRRNTSGASPSSASPTTIASGRIGISSAKRWMFCQSIASSRSKPSSSESVGVDASRMSAAASPPRICGPLVRTINPYSPAFAAASSRSVPAVITPLPPLPAIAIEMLRRAPRDVVFMPVMPVALRGSFAAPPPSDVEHGSNFATAAPDGR